MEASWIAAKGHTEPQKSGNHLLWIVDSGASRHITYDHRAFSDFQGLIEPISITTASGLMLQGTGQGIVALEINIDGAKRAIALTEVLYVPGLAGSLISVFQLQDRGIIVRTTIISGASSSSSSLLIERYGRTIGVTERLGKAYALKTAIGGALQAIEDPI